MSARMHLLLLFLLWDTMKHTYLVLPLYPNKQIYLTGFTSFLSFWIKLPVCSIIKIPVLLTGFFVRNPRNIMSNNIDVQVILSQESDFVPYLSVIPNPKRLAFAYTSIGVTIRQSLSIFLIRHCVSVFSSSEISTFLSIIIMILESSNLLSLGVYKVTVKILV